MPVTLSHAVTEFQCSANMAFAMYGGLTMGATAALIVHGKPDQKKMFVPKMVAGEWTGTMNLTEPQCGTDLGLLRTKAVKQGDGSYKITGTKIFISSGEHDLSVARRQGRTVPASQRPIQRQHPRPPRPPRPGEL